MRVAIVGSRRWARWREVREFVRGLPQDAVVVSGGAQGVDSIAVDEARGQGMAFVEITPNYKRDGYLAPKLRNREIAEICDRMVAFWDGESGGTANAVTWAIALGKPVEVRR